MISCTVMDRWKRVKYGSTQDRSLRELHISIKTWLFTEISKVSQLTYFLNVEIKLVAIYSCWIFIFLINNLHKLRPFARRSRSFRLVYKANMIQDLFQRMPWRTERTGLELLTSTPKRTHRDGHACKKIGTKNNETKPLFHWKIASFSIYTGWGPIQQCYVKQLEGLLSCQCQSSNDSSSDWNRIVVCYYVLKAYLYQFDHKLWFVHVCVGSIKPLD